MNGFETWSLLPQELWTKKSYSFLYGWSLVPGFESLWVLTSCVHTELSNFTHTLEKVWKKYIKKSNNINNNGREEEQSL